MRLSSKIRLTISLVIISISVFVWVLLLINPGHILTIEHCHVYAASRDKAPAGLNTFSNIPRCSTSDSGPSTKSLQMMLETNPFSSQLIGWGLMVLAMMLPKLIIPIQFIYSRSLKRLRFLSSLLFVLGYLASWMVAGFFMIVAIMGLNLLMPMSYIPALGVFIIAVVWQFSPIKQRSLNRGHDHWTLSAFGWAASRDALMFGVVHGVWCIVSGWALMLFPMLLSEGHNVVMIIVTLIMLSEHLESPKIPRWAFHFRLKLFRIIIAQTRTRLKPLLAQ